MRRLGLAGFAALLLSTSACTGSDSSDASAKVEVKADAIEAARLAEAWPVRFARQDSFGGYAQGGWIPLMMKRNYRVAVEKMGDDAAGQARAHADAALLYRQAALMSANAAIQTYHETPEPTDPVGVAHLLAVAFALQGDLDKAKEYSAKLDGVEDPTTPWHEPWKTWLAAGGSWPPDLKGLPVELPEAAPGSWPSVDAGPHYSLPEQGESTYTRDMGDLGALVALALWHEAAAKAAAGDNGGALDAYLARYRLPGESAGAPADLTEGFLFASDYLNAADGPFLADVMAGKGAAAIEQHAGKSLLALVAKRSLQDGQINAEKAIDEVALLREALLAESAKVTDGNTEAHHRIFANVAKVGTLRNLALVAEALGNGSDEAREAGGRLRINAMEASEGPTGCPVGLMALAAWDAGNRYPTRAQEIVHDYQNLYPSLEIARFGLDVLALRVSRERPGEGAGM